MVVFCFGLCFALLQSNSQRKTGMLKRNFRVVPPGERTNPQRKPVGNRILLAIPDNEYRAIRPGLEFLSLPHHRILYEPNKKFEYVYLPNNGLISLVIVMADRKTVEVAVLGREGIAAVPSIFGLLKSPICDVVQIAGDGFRIKVNPFRRALRSSPVLQDLLGRYSVVLAMQISQTAACNRLHDILSGLTLDCRHLTWRFGVDSPIRYIPGFRGQPTALDGSSIYARSCQSARA